MNKLPVMEPTPEWESREPMADEHERGDPLWRMKSYRLAVLALEVGWDDARLLDRIRVTRRVAPQLYGAIGSIGANIADGYGRSSGADRVRFFEYALCSVRESAVWYRAARPVLGQALVAARIELLARIRPLLLVTIPRERSRRLRPRQEHAPEDGRSRTDGSQPQAAGRKP